MGHLMKNLDEHIDILINSCKSTIQQMTKLEVGEIDKRLFLKDKHTSPFAHIISYTEYDNKVDGDFILGFGSINDALKLSSAIAERLGIGKFHKICEDSTDLLNEFLNIVVGRTISDWDRIGLKVKFGTPVFKKNFESKGPKQLKGYVISMDLISNTVNLEENYIMNQLLLNVYFIQKVENKIENKTILLAEDSNVMRRIIGKMLEEHGAKIKEAKDGEEAVKLHKKYAPDLTLMDINMPKMNGFEAIAQIRKSDSKSKFIMLTSSSRKDEIITAKALNVLGYLVKPVDQSKLIERISAII